MTQVTLEQLSTVRMNEQDTLFVPRRGFWCSATGIDIRIGYLSHVGTDILLRYMQWELACYIRDTCENK